MSSKVILSVGHNEIALATRNAILRHAEYEVIAATHNNVSVIPKARSANCVLIGQSIEWSTREKLTRDLRAQYPEKPILLLHLTNEPDDLEAATFSVMRWTARTSG
jgi:DNA-binding NarL/FixJ family response regulator